MPPARNQTDYSNQSLLTRPRKSSRRHLSSLTEGKMTASCLAMKSFIIGLRPWLLPPSLDQPALHSKASLRLRHSPHSTCRA